MTAGEWISLIGIVVAVLLAVVGGVYGVLRGIMAKVEANHLAALQSVADSRHDLRQELHEHVGKVEMDCADRLERLRDRIDSQQREIILPLMKLAGER